MIKKIHYKFPYKIFFPLFFALILIFIIAIFVFVLKKLSYGISYQKSASMPKGIYLMLPAKEINRGDLVIFYPPKKAADFAHKNHWLPDSNILLKQVFGIPNDFVCNYHQVIEINGKILGKVYDFYAPGKKMPHRQFCAKLKDEQYLLLSTYIDRSYDGRYFGPVLRQQIIAKAKLIKKLN